MKTKAILLILAGLALPVVSFGLTGLLVEPPTGMDGYVPAFIGGFVGLLLGGGAIAVGIGRLIAGRGD